jgi:hypothetical protein
MLADNPLSWHQALRRDGYAHFRESLAPTLIEAARNKIRHSVENHFDPRRMNEYNNRSWCPELRSSSEIKQLFENTAVRAIVDGALGSNQYGYDAGQIAIRQARSADWSYPPTPHIDGIPTAHNGLSGTGIQNFTALLGVFLTEVNCDYAGNFTVWPGSHVVIEQYFQERGEAALQAGMPNIPLGEPIQLYCRPGDVVLCHYELAHAAAVNTSENDRIAVFFRLWLNEINGADGREQRWHNLTHLWHGWQI